jgi:hypothetical protein
MIPAFRAPMLGHAGGVRSTRADPVPPLEFIMSTPAATTPSDALADVEQRITAAAKEREQTDGGTVSGSR